MKSFCIPPEQDGEFVARMEDVLSVYERPHDEKRPVVCLDETSKEVRGDARPLIEARPGGDGEPATPARQDYEYVRHGTASVFMVYEPLAGRCHTEVSARRTALDYARIIKHLCDVMYPRAEKIVLVQDNLNTHSIGSLYQAFEPEEARRLAERLEVHYTPKHGSWLNMAEIALRLLSCQCLAQRFPSREELTRAVDAWQKLNDSAPMKTNWRFTAKDARIKLKRLYPVIHNQMSI